MTARTAVRMKEKSDAASTAVATEPGPAMEMSGARLHADAARRRATSAPPNAIKSSRSVRGAAGGAERGRRKAKPQSGAPPATAIAGTSGATPPAANCALADLMESRARRLAEISASRADSGESPAPALADTVRAAGDDIEAGAAALMSRIAASPASTPRDMGRGGSDSTAAWNMMAPPHP